jgi:hypothetical protein
MSNRLSKPNDDELAQISQNGLQKQVEELSLNFGDGLVGQAAAVMG